MESFSLQQHSQAIKRHFKDCLLDTIKDCLTEQASIQGAMTHSIPVDWLSAVSGVSVVHLVRIINSDASLVLLKTCDGVYDVTFIGSFEMNDGV